MNKTLLGIAVVAVLVVAFGTTGFVYAQAPSPDAPETGYGNGIGGGRGSRGGGMMEAPGFEHDDEVMHDTMMNIYAEKLGISVADLEARLDNGETMSQVASSAGLTVDEFFALMAEARSAGVDQALKDGTLTQEQADYMNQRSTSVGGRGQGTGMRQFNNMDCPVVDDNS